jgi:pimeloyl-ACP methyl ester carboxylesterase
MMQERRFDTGIVELNYGEGPRNGTPFVILHGGAGSWHYADALIALLTDRWHLFAPDLRGHGDSGHVPGKYQLRDYSGDIIAFLAGVVREPAVIYGHSLGGEVAIMVAATRPDLVRAVIHGDVAFSYSNEQFHSEQARNIRAQNELWHRIAGKPETEIEVALRDMPIQLPGAAEYVRAEDAFGKDSEWFAFQASNLHRLDPDMLAAWLAGPDYSLAGYDPEMLLPAISCPVLILQGDPDAGGAMSDAQVEVGLKLLPNPNHILLKGIGHPLHGTNAQEVFDAITPFLEEVVSSESPVGRV